MYNKEREFLVRDLLDKILDASIEGDFKTVRKLAKKIHKLAIGQEMLN